MRIGTRLLVLATLVALASGVPAHDRVIASPVHQVSAPPTKEPTKEPTTDAATDPATEPDQASRETPVAWWQWIVLALLVGGALGAMAASRRRPRSRAEEGLGREVLLAQIQRLATRATEVAPTDDEIRYQRATIRALTPLLAHEIAVESDAPTRTDLQAVSTALGDLSRTLKAARRTSVEGPERARVHEAAAVVGERLAALRSEIREPDGDAP